MSNLFRQNLAEHTSLCGKMNELSDWVQTTAEMMAESVLAGGTVMLCGNGGSAADSQHIAAEFMGRFIDDRDPISSIALTTDSSALTCIGNDYSYDNIFARQVAGLGRANDCLIGISTSGNSQNIFNAVTVANDIGMKTIGLLGRDGGRIADICSINIIVPSFSTARIQEMHILLGHTLVGIVENMVKASD